MSKSNIRQYTRPRLIRLGQEQRDASGLCSTGSSDAGDCDSGNSAGNRCAAGSDAGDACVDGNIPSMVCSSGTFDFG